MHRLYSHTCLLLLLTACTSSTNTMISSPEKDNGWYPEDSFDQTALSAHLRFLASDELMGRNTGHYGSDVAARYIAEQFRASGLLPVPGAQEYYQPVPLAESAPAVAGRLTLMRQTFVNGEQMLVLDGASIDVSAPFVFAGYGVSDDDYRGTDVSGKIVITRAGMPGDQGIRAALNGYPAKQKAAVQRGAVALVELYNLDFPWANILRYLGRTRVGVDESANESASSLPHVWINDAENSISETITTSRNEVAVLISSGIRKRSFSSFNVVGMVTGSDPDLRDEFVVLMAHYDHIGAGMQAGAGATPADSIFNGARDNGMGTVAVIGAAQALSKYAPARSVIFLAVTGEEKGMLGSGYYASHPLIPLEKTVYALNIDGGGYSDTTIVTFVGKGRTNADDVIEKAVATYRLRTIDDPTPDQNLFDRSDNVAFAGKGVPAPTFSPGFRSFDEKGVVEYYHRPQDEADDIDFAYLKRFIQAYTRSARLIADMPERPYWLPGDRYETVARELYRED